MNRLKKRYKIARLIARKVLGMLSEEDAGILEAWMEESKKHQEEMVRVEERLKGDLRRGGELNKEEEWKAFQRRLPRRNTIRWWYSAAAMIVGVCLVVGVLQFREREPASMQLSQSMGNRVKEYKAKLILDDGRSVNITDSTCYTIAVSEGAKAITSGNGLIYETKNAGNASTSVKYNTLIVPRGGEYELVLADGTRVWMNSESKIVYPVQFNGASREVQMEGEVCFKVAKNEKQPFIVRTKEISVTVLGTFFNVEAYPDEKNATTTLVEGRVNVSDGKQSRIMSPNQQVVVEGDKLTVHEVDATEIVRWVQGICYFSETSLGDIMNKLARWYDIDVFFANVSAKDAHFSLEIERYDNISTVLSKIEKTGRVKFKINGRTVIVEE
ncbi:MULTISPECIES: FecR family protein [Butyricimonas]|uniref:FecR family protein n=1 Tax=Butyricimonas TaxID=574697 RepID=UPI0007FB3DE4|nr:MULTISPECIES: FecR family protein [Butyricimonas]